MTDAPPSNPPPSEPAGSAAAGTAAPGDASVPAPAPPLLDIDQFLSVQLRTAKVVTAERVPKADKLLRLVVDLGGETRQIVAGIAATYTPEELVGRTIVVVANLKPAKLRGVESQGMLLAADAGAGPIILTLDKEVPPGTRVR